MNSYHLDVLRRVVELSPANSIDTVLTFCRYTLFNKGADFFASINVTFFVVIVLYVLLADFVYHANFFKDRGIGVINASPVGMGLMAETIPHWHPGEYSRYLHLKLFFSPIKKSRSTEADKGDCQESGRIRQRKRLHSW